MPKKASNKNMKKLVLFIALTTLVSSAFCQKEKDNEDEKKGGFKKENVFVGGSATLSFYSGGSVIGANPYIGYSINKFIDAAFVVNFTYTGERPYSGEKIRQYVYGPGAFVRIYPIKMIFLHASYEHNFLSVKYIPPSGSGYSTQKFKEQSNSYLLGAGYCNGRQSKGDFFYYFSVMWDVKKDLYSPYTEQLQDGSIRAVPIIRAGIQLPIFQGKNKRDED